MFSGERTTPKEYPNDAYTVVFLLDALPPKKVILLKRAPWKKFAPNRYTGIGGRIEAGETALDGAFRELLEETGLTDLPLVPFAQCHVPGRVIHYYWSVFPGGELPPCNEGNLEWVELEQILEKEIIATTQLVIEEWQRRGFSLTESWTLFARITGELDDWAARELDRVESGLKL